MAGEVRVNLRTWFPVRVGLALLLLGLLALGVWVAQVYGTARSLQAHLVAAEALASDDPLLALSDPEAVGQLLTGLRADVVALQRQTGGLVRSAPAFRWLPKVGPLLGDAPALLDMGDGLTEAGVILWDAFAPALQVWQSGEGDLLESFAIALEQAQPYLGEARAAVQRAQEARAQLTVELLPWRLREPLVKLDAVLPWLDDGLAVAEVAPELLGMDGERKYLILAQNEDELRATGGFISGAGVLTLAQGRIAGLTFMDSYAVDDYLNKPYDFPPEPLYRIMGSELWLFRDVNWFPDFPTSAREAARLYTYGQGVEVDGVIALDQRALELLLHGIGAVAIPELDAVVTADNIRQFMRQAWNPDAELSTGEWIRQRKDFMGELAHALLGKLEQYPGKLDWVLLAQQGYQALQQRHLLIYSEQPQIQKVLAELKWDGALRESPGDYLLVVDTNVGFGKVDPLVTRDLRYAVSLHEDGTATAELTVTYVHQGEREGIICNPMVRYDADVTYAAMMQRCYYDYLRVYVPASSVLLEAQAHPTPGEYLIMGQPLDGAPERFTEAGKTVWAQFFVVEYGQTLTKRWVYELPAVVEDVADGERYTLLLQKQAGLDAVPVDISLRLPSNAVVLDWWPQPTAEQGNVVNYQFDLRVDSSLSVRYRVPEGDKP